MKEYSSSNADGEAISQVTVVLVDVVSLLNLQTPGYEGFLEAVARQQLASASSDDQGGFSLYPILNPAYLIAANQSGIGLPWQIRAAGILGHLVRALYRGTAHPEESLRTIRGR